ncbi:hypothetical protein LO762_31835 [Actinocorallia sp. API 0066]|uniref:hypothetical protein n=1 Tax=Actinocorallia sp. API 0066 TaxID=2896846 RepID=UPI001E59B6AF|nr:hypothetical protein [Actinocorallia sp. API 0066]MCD0453742.1 hypothetical protein [Actinocorallia sp. API 0066]
MTSVKDWRPADGHPAWCTHPHRDDEPHYGPCADAEAVNVEGEGLLICYNRELDGTEEMSIIPITNKPIPLVGRPSPDELRFTLEQAIGLRDAITQVLAEVTGEGKPPTETPSA